MESDRPYGSTISIFKSGGPNHFETTRGDAFTAWKELDELDNNVQLFLR